MTDATDRCEPPPEWREKFWMHFLVNPDGEQIFATWETPEDWPDSRGVWQTDVGAIVPRSAARQGFRYLAPVTPPATVAALVEALEQYADQYCEGWCKEAGGQFSDCGGCRARAALAAYREAGR